MREVLAGSAPFDEKDTLDEEYHDAHPDVDAGADTVDVADVRDTSTSRA